MGEEGAPVKLYLYDLSHGMAAQLSPFLLADLQPEGLASSRTEGPEPDAAQPHSQRVEGIWHTGVVVFGKEHYFGSEGITSCPPGGTVLGQPLQVIDLGTTHVTRSVFNDYVHGLARNKFRGESYSLLKHNCNNFSDELSQFLVGKPIPAFITELPENVVTLLRSTFGDRLDGLIGQLGGAADPRRTDWDWERGPRAESPDFERLNSAIEEARRASHLLEEKRHELKEKLARRERKKAKKKKRRSKEVEEELVHGRPCQWFSESEVKKSGMADGVEVAPQAAATTENSERESGEGESQEEPRKPREPPVIFKDAVDIRVEFDALVGLIDGKLSGEEMQSLEELHQYMLEDEGSWALGDGFLSFIGRMLHDSNLGEEVPVRCLNVLACAALKDDVILLLHQDRKEHVLMNYAHDVDRLPLGQQKSLALFMCNLFENLSSSEWMLYISEWQFCNTPVSNIRVTTKVAVNSLLSDDLELRDRGTAIIHNLACKEKMQRNKNLRRILPAGSISKVFDDVAVELTMAILQFFNSDPPEEQLFRCMKALARFCQISSQDVPQLIRMIGPEPARFKGRSERIDSHIAEISKKLR